MAQQYDSHKMPLLTSFWEWERGRQIQSDDALPRRTPRDGKRGLVAVLWHTMKGGAHTWWRSLAETFSLLRSKGILRASINAQASGWVSLGNSTDFPFHQKTQCGWAGKRCTAANKQREHKQDEFYLGIQINIPVSYAFRGSTGLASKSASSAPIDNGPPLRGVFILNDTGSGPSPRSDRANFRTSMAQHLQASDRAIEPKV
uniref:Uncharacterized protein n=1 Tax=Hypholoma sublateritium (strain FD-334 SS-4) TaxID=945553 RepID=A0A0D2NWQ8_HYPSF